VETAHQERLAKIQEKGKTRQRQIDVEAEQKTLEELQWNLEQAYLQQAEFSEKTKESTRRAKEHQIAELQGQIAEQEKMLDDHYNGRLVVQGQNISGELAAEEERYNKEMQLMDQQLAKQQELQRQKMGQMMLDTFQVWAEQKEIPADKMVEMRTAIAQEYGLIDDETANVVNYMTGEWETWSKDFGTSAEDVMGKMGEVITETGEIKKYVDELPSEWKFTVTMEKVGFAPGEFGGAVVPGPTALPPGGLIEAQRGWAGMVGPGFGGARLFLAGEHGPERVVVEPANRIYNEAPVTNNINDYRVYELLEQQRRMARRRNLGRLMG